MSEMDMEDPEYKAKQLRFEYSTDELIAELETRRPCEMCKFRLSSLCMTCTWRDVWDMAGKNDHKDNFKEAK